MADPPGLTMKHLIYVKRKHVYIKSTRHLKPTNYDRFSECIKRLKLMIEEKMETNLNDDENDPAYVNK